MPSFDYYTVINVATVGDDPGTDGIDTTLAAAVGLEATVTDAVTGEVVPTFIPGTTSPRPLMAGASGWGLPFDTETAHQLKVQFGSLPAFTLSSIEMGNALPAAEVAADSAEASATSAANSAADAARARSAAELAAANLANATASAIRAADGTKIPLTVAFLEDGVPDGAADGSFFLVGLRSLPA